MHADKTSHPRPQPHQLSSAANDLETKTNDLETKITSLDIDATSAMVQRVENRTATLNRKLIKFTTQVVAAGDVIGRLNSLESYTPWSASMPAVLDVPAVTGDSTLKGFRSGFTAGDYGYLVPHNNGANHGKAVRISVV